MEVAGAVEYLYAVVVCVSYYYSVVAINGNTFWESKLAISFVKGAKSKLEVAVAVEYLYAASVSYYY